MWCCCAITASIDVVRPGCARTFTRAALLVDQHGLDPARSESVLIASADDLGRTATDPSYGKGRINVANALGIDGQASDTFHRSANGPPRSSGAGRSASGDPERRQLAARRRPAAELLCRATTRAKVFPPRRRG